jgi:membrane-bound lytic murein transglycosylase D
MMKKLFTIVICLFLSQFSKASDLRYFNPDANTFKLNAGQNYMISVAKQDTGMVPVITQIPLTSYQDVTFKRQLDSIAKDVPLDYNEFVQNYIDIYTAPGRRGQIGRMLGLGKYYFPIYEKALRETGIPEEIKFLSIVESELNPNAVSRVGATGPWQFMFATGKAYGLNIDGYVDERRDPIQASYAAAAYLRDAYKEFGDWLLAIASYNCGKGNVTRAMEKSGGTDFWSIREYLPAETRGYVPAYIAMTYVMNYYNKYHIIPQACNFSMRNDTVMVNKYVSLNSIARVLDVDATELALLNPSYKRQIVNGSIRAPRRLVIPQAAKDKYGALYEALNTDALAVAPQVTFASNKEEVSAVEKVAWHKVKKGETLGDVADTYGVEVQDLKVWNRLQSNRVVPGQRLRLTENTDETYAPKKAVEVKTFVTYKVRRGDTLSQIADKFDGATIDKIRELNGLKNGKLQPGMTLKISKA